MIRESLALSGIPQLGPLSARKIVKAYTDLSELFHSSPEEISQRSGLSRSLAYEIAHFKRWKEVDQELQAAESLGVQLLSLCDDRYPPLLKAIPDPPWVLYLKGELSLLESPLIGIVGSRVASRYGVEMAREIALGLSQRGIGVVSGLALGIDAEAHRGALIGGKGTVGVLGCGIDIVYPASNRELYREMLEGDRGLLVSEFSIGTPPIAGQFPRRNRLISGLSRGVVVVEAALKSGSLITARLAAEQGREVFAVPGSVRSARSAGTHRLIQQGAKLVASVEDILEEFPDILTNPSFSTTFPPLPSVVGPLPPGGEGVIELLKAGPLSMDELIAKVKVAEGELYPLLLELELSGWVEQLPGQCYSLTGRFNG